MDKKPYLVYIGVNPDWQNQGLGTFMCQYLEYLATRRGDTELSIFAALEPSFFEQLGYSQTIDPLVMSKTPSRQSPPPAPQGYEIVETRNFSEWCGVPVQGVFVRIGVKNGPVVAKVRLEFRAREELTYGQG